MALNIARGSSIVLTQFIPSPLEGIRQLDREGTMEQASNPQAFRSTIQESASGVPIDPSVMLLEGIEHVRDHRLRKPLGVMHIWGLGVGSVISGMFFGWNFGLVVAGPIGMLIASLVVCGLYLTWVLGLSELSVAMPFAGGPMTYGRRAFGKAMGFFMGWSMFLECLFAATGTALATGGYAAFVLNPDHPDRLTAAVCSIGCVLLFLVVQYLGVKEQARITLWLTWAAIGALVLFWITAAPGISLDRVWTTPLLPNGFRGVLTAIPYALWWLVVIEAVALASEEARDSHVTIPRGMVLAQITLAITVILTWFFTSAAAGYRETGPIAYPLPFVLKNVWGVGWFLKVFSIVAFAGLAASYCGTLYATSRQAFSLGRAGYLPPALGRVHPTRRTPHLSLLICTLATIAFLIYGYFYEEALNVAILISTLAAVIWYVLAMACLVRLRQREPAMQRRYRVPAYPWLVIFVAVLAAFAAYLYAWVNVKVLIPTVILYGGAAIWYVVRGRRSVLAIAPEETAARIAERSLLNEQEVGTPAVRSGQGFVAGVLLCGLLSLVWMVVRSTKVIPGPIGTLEIAVVGAIWTVLFLVVSWIGFGSTRSQA